jgi:hypothetical protein
VNNNIVRLFLTLVFCSSVTRILCATDVGMLHGTVNIILANKNGLVAVTDSRLSHFKLNNRPEAVGVAQKLFQLDAETICTVAGDYAVYGPPIEDNEILGIGIVSRAIADLTKKQEWKSIHSVADKSRFLTSQIAMYFQTYLTLNQFIGIRKKFGLQVTVAGYDSSGISVIQSNLIGNESSSFILPEPLEHHEPGQPCGPVTGETTAVIKDSFKSFLAGIPDFYNCILEFPEDKIGGISDADKQSISVYRVAKTSGSLDNLTLNDLRKLAVAMAHYSEFQDTPQIGGEVQIATMANHSVSMTPSVTEMKLDIPLPAIKQAFVFVANETLLGGPLEIPLPNQFNVYSGNVVRGTKQRLTANMLMVSNLFDNVTFIYGGEKPIIFDPSVNAFDNCSIELEVGTDWNDPFVRAFMKKITAPPPAASPPVASK